MTDRELVQQALELLSDAQQHHYALKHNETDAFVAALRSRLAEPEPEIKRLRAERDKARAELATLRAQNYVTQSLLAGAEAAMTKEAK